MSAILEGKLSGVYQENDRFIARFTPSDKESVEIDIPITGEQFHGLKMGVPVKIIVQFLV
jgi:hypothetical protein